MDDQRINKLAHKWLKGTITDPELKELDDWFAQDDAAPLEIPTDSDENCLQYRLYNKIAERGNLQSEKRKTVRRLWPRIAAAASILVVLSAGGYFLTHKKVSIVNTAIAKNDIAPGGNKAILHLGNGKTIILTDAKNGILANQNNTAINKASAGQIAYNSLKGLPEAAAMVYDTLTTPRGGIWHIELADGSIVWLNAATSIRYPESFIGKERLVELINGEAYFEVAHNAAKPFNLVVNGQTIKDIGTSFNVNAYNDDPIIKTTLLDGSIKLIKGVNQVTLKKSGQQAITMLAENKIKIKDVNIEPVMAWKEGFFRFDNDDLNTIMRQFSRWYDVQVVYDGQMKEHEFVGKISRNSNLSKVLKILASGGVHYKIEGKKLIVQP